MKAGPSAFVPAGAAFATHDLGRDDYPIAILAFFPDGDQARIVWAVTLIAPPAGAKVMLRVPPLKVWNEGREIDVATMPAATAFAMLVDQRV